MGGEKERDTHNIVTIHPKIRDDLFRLKSYSLSILSFAQKSGMKWNSSIGGKCAL
jgi:hypothetical protein